MSILLYRCTTWTLTKRREKKLDGNFTKMLWAVMNKSWKQHSIKQPLYGHLPLISKTIQVRRKKHAGNCWRNKNELISSVLLLTPSQGRASVGRSAGTYLEQLCMDTGCCLGDLPRAMEDRYVWGGSVKEIRARGLTWWWWSVREISRENNSKKSLRIWWTTESL